MTWLSDPHLWKQVHCVKVKLTEASRDTKLLPLTPHVQTQGTSTCSLNKELRTVLYLATVLISIYYNHTIQPNKTIRKPSNQILLLPITQSLSGLLWPQSLIHMPMIGWVWQF